MTVISPSPEAAAYLAQVGARLGDLPSQEREEILADIEVTLAESEAENGGSLVERFGPPDRFADELRAAAGLRAPERAAELSPLQRRLRQLAAHPRSERALRLTRELAPIGWLVRAYSCAALAVGLGLGHWGWGQQVVPTFGSRLGSVIVLGALLSGSIALGLRARERPPGGAWRWAALGLNVALATVAVVVGVRAATQERPVQDPCFGSFPCPAAAPAVAGIANGGNPISNLYPFDRNGRPLYDVTLYDQNGKPLNIGGPNDSDPNRRIATTIAGRQLFNSFPIRYHEPGSERVANPTAGPRHRGPRIATPPLIVAGRPHRATRVPARGGTAAHRRTQRRASRRGG
jgi:hypothetical protein